MAAGEADRLTVLIGDNAVVVFAPLPRGRERRTNGRFDLAGIIAREPLDLRDPPFLIGGGLPALLGLLPSAL
jgi:hypothetical protein